MKRFTTIENKVLKLALKQLSKPLHPRLLRLQKLADDSHAKASERPA